MAAGTLQQMTVTLADAFANPVAKANPASLFQVVVAETSGTQADDWQEELLQGGEAYSVSASMASPGTAQVSFMANISGVYEVNRVDMSALLCPLSCVLYCSHMCTCSLAWATAGLACKRQRFRAPCTVTRLC